MPNKFCFVLLLATSTAWACGKERASIKNLADNPKLHLAGAMTVEQMRALARPADLHQRAQLETKIVTTQAFLVAFKLEDDEDIHLVLADPSTHRTIIAEIPASHCGRKSEAKYYDRARDFIVQAAGPLPSVGRLKKLPQPIPIRLRGVIFFDFLHRQTGVAPNGVELHPVVLIAHQN